MASLSAELRLNFWYWREPLGSEHSSGRIQWADSCRLRWGAQAARAGEAPLAPFHCLPVARLLMARGAAAPSGLGEPRVAPPSAAASRGPPGPLVPATLLTASVHGRTAPSVDLTDPLDLGLPTFRAGRRAHPLVLYLFAL